ncbi:MAG: DUF3298 and DUF4163 domain-containing protein [Treponemataceae bacterium]|nr:MAG: DUF3298 and DUF4163 domain-containing protein [Treponemataceae bacterium]
MKITTKILFVICVLLVAGVISCSSIIFISKENIANVFPSAVNTKNKTDADLKITGTIPVVAGEDELNGIIKRELGAGLKTFQNIAHASSSTDAKDYSYDLAWRVGRHDTEYVSILTDAQWYVGGAHGEQELKTFNWKVSAQRNVTFNELLDLAGFSDIYELSKYVRKELTLKMDSTDKSWKQMIEEGASPNESNFRTAFIERNGVTFYFQRYQVAPGYAGIQSVKIHR